MTGRLWLLAGAVLAAGSAALTGFVRSDNSPADLGLFIGLMAALSGLWLWLLRVAAGGPPPVRYVIAFALLYRLLLLPSGLIEGGTPRLILYDDDVWRYIWEGHAWSAGVNPAKIPPAGLDEYDLEMRDPALRQRLYPSARWSAIYDNVGYRDIASPYPPLVHGLFRLVDAIAPGSVLGFKLLATVFDLGVLVLLARRDAFAALAWGWCPLVVKEFAGSAHLDSALAFALTAAAWRQGSLWLAAGVLIKPVALFLAPAMARREGLRTIAACGLAIAGLVWFAPRGLADYTAHWTFNPALFRLIPLPRPAALATAGAVLVILALWLLRRDDGSREAWERQQVWLLGGFLLLTPMFAPWYIAWILPAAALRRAWYWLALAAFLCLSYHAVYAWREWPAVTLSQFLAPTALWWIWRRRSRLPASGIR